MSIRSLGLAAVLALCVAVPSQAAQSTKGTQTAYRYALRCFVLAGTADPRGAKAAYDAAIRLGGVQGLSNRQMNRDFADAIATENIRFLRDQPYRQRVQAECRQLGMAS